jgi:hypothetical protein
MKTIIGFDGWTQGASHFFRLFPELNKRGYRLILIHVGSWGHDIGRPKEELFGEMVVRDISYYDGKSFAEILNEERPYCVLFINTRAIAHRAFNRWAQFKKIPTCHSYHGLVRSVANGEMYASTNYLQHIKIVYKRIAVNLLKIIPVYIKALIVTRADIHIWSSFLISILEKLISRKLSSKNYIVDTQTSIGCVYLDSERAHMIENYAIPDNCVHVVGNPDLMRFGLKVSDMGYRCFTDTVSRTILYIDTALSKSGVVFSSDNDFVKHLELTNKALAVQGYTILVKLHPAHLQSDVPQQVERSGIKLCKDEEFILLLKSATAAIVEPSSAALIPALLGLPLLLAQFNKLSGAPYGDMISSYPRARNLCDIHHVTQLLDEERSSLKSENVMSWITANAGPMPAEDMPVRVVDAIDHLILDKNKFNNDE